MEHEDDLENLFETLSAQRIAEENAEKNSCDHEDSADTEKNKSVITQIGKMTRALHDTLRDLGVSKDIERAASSIPDARDRLNYVATLTQEAAEKVLTAIETAEPVVSEMKAGGQQLSVKWDRLMSGKMGKDEFKLLMDETNRFVHLVPASATTINIILTDIMMAQGFQDLTGQVIKKIIEVTAQMEQQLLGLLLDSAPREIKGEYDAGLLNGPVINSDGRTDIVNNQNQVDDLLASMGF